MMVGMMVQVVAMMRSPETHASDSHLNNQSYTGLRTSLSNRFIFVRFFDCKVQLAWVGKKSGVTVGSTILGEYLPQIGCEDLLSLETLLCRRPGPTSPPRDCSTASAGGQIIQYADVRREICGLMPSSTAAWGAGDNDVALLFPSASC
jgi:hypothetical protein